MFWLELDVWANCSGFIEGAGWAAGQALEAEGEVRASYCKIRDNKHFFRSEVSSKKPSEPECSRKATLIFSLSQQRWPITVGWRWWFSNVWMSPLVYSFRYRWWLFFFSHFDSVVVLHVQPNVPHCSKMVSFGVNVSKENVAVWFSFFQWGNVFCKGGFAYFMSPSVNNFVR